jgi:hypothetical protein
VCDLSNCRGKYWAVTPFFDLPLRESFFY